MTPTTLLRILALLVVPVVAHLLTPQNFEQTISEGVWFIEHFSPYCRHCRHFEPIWNDVVDHFEAKTDPGVHLGQVNCAINGDLCNDNGVTGYPQMNLYRNGELVETYSGDREFHFVVEFLNAHVEPTATSPDEVEVATPTPTSTEQELIPTPTEQELTPTPTPTPAEHLVVQTPRSNANPSGTVVALDVQSFDSYLAQGPTFIKFFAPWCGHCKKLAPVWAQLGRRMQHKLNIAEVDCENHKALCTSQGVTGFPMMFFYAHGVKTEYTGGRSYDQLIAFADKASNPNMQVIDVPGLDTVVHDNPVVYLLLHDGSDPRIMNDIAKTSQFLLGSPPVYVSTAPELLDKHTAPALLAFKDKDARTPVATYALTSTSSDHADIRAWLHANRFARAFELSREVFQQVMYAPHHPLVLIVATPRARQELVSTKLTEVAQKWQLGGAPGRDVVFTWMDADQWTKWLKDMYRVKVGSEPVIIVADHERLVYYDRDGSGNAIALNSVSVASALEAISAGTAHLKHSQNVLERGVHSLNAGIVRMEGLIVAHPYMTVLAILGLVGVVVMALRSLFGDDPMDLEVEKRRLD